MSQIIGDAIWLNQGRLMWPVLAPGSSWYKGTTSNGNIRKINIVDSGVPNPYSESWDASEAQDGSIMAYLNGTTVTIVGNGSGGIMANADSSKAFHRFRRIGPSSNINILNTKNVTNMDSMFQQCHSLTRLDLSGWDTRNVTSMRHMFYYIDNMEELDLSNWNTKNVTNMDSMFADNSVITTIRGISGWDTSNVTNMREMFSTCTELTSLDLSGWDTSNVTNMSGMFSDCRRLTTVTLGEKFAFIGTDGYLPTPTSNYIPGADGKWYSTTTGIGYAPSEIPNNTADTYTAVKPTIS